MVKFIIQLFLIALICIPNLAGATDVSKQQFNIFLENLIETSSYEDITSYYSGQNDVAKMYEKIYINEFKNKKIYKNNRKALLNDARNESIKYSLYFISDDYIKNNFSKKNAEKLIMKKLLILLEYNKLYDEWKSIIIKNMERETAIRHLEIAFFMIGILCIYITFYIKNHTISVKIPLYITSISSLGKAFHPLFGIHSVSEKAISNIKFISFTSFILSTTIVLILYWILIVSFHILKCKNTKIKFYNILLYILYFISYFIFSYIIEKEIFILIILVCIILQTATSQYILRKYKIIANSPSN